MKAGPLTASTFKLFAHSGETGCRGGIWTRDLQVMSLASYRAAPPRVGRPVCVKVGRCAMLTLLRFDGEAASLHAPPEVVNLLSAEEVEPPVIDDTNVAEILLVDRFLLFCCELL